MNCMKGKCIHGSTAKSAIGMMEAEFWKWKGTYKYIDTMICCSEFMKSKMDSNPLFATKTVAMHNFIDKVEWKETEKKDYVLYFGRFSEEKGIGTLIKVCKELPDVQFIFAGTGPLEETVNGIKNIKNVGFQKGEELEKLIRASPNLNIYVSLPPFRCRNLFKISVLTLYFSLFFYVLFHYLCLDEALPMYCS